MNFNYIITIFKFLIFLKYKCEINIKNISKAFYKKIKLYLIF